MSTNWWSLLTKNCRIYSKSTKFKLSYQKNATISVILSLFWNLSLILAKKDENMIKMHKLCLNLTKKLLKMTQFTNFSEFYQSLLTKIQKIESKTTDFCFFL